MHVFVTGASGFIGRAVVADLVAAGHQVTGLARSDQGAQVVADLGAEVRRGDLDDPAGIAEGARGADAVVHLANKHDWSDPAASNAAERAATTAIGDALAGTGKAFVLASGTVQTATAPGHLAAETDPTTAVGPDSPRGGSEHLALSYAGRDVRVIAARFAPTVHGEGDHGFVRIVADDATRRGVAVYPGDGSNRWAAVHLSDVARLVRLGLERAEAGTVLHGVGEEGVVVRELVEALAARRGLPVESRDAELLATEIPFIGGFLGSDIPASSAATQALLDWRPSGPTLLADIAAGHYDA